MMSNVGCWCSHIMPFSLMKWLLTEEEFCLGRSRKRFLKHFTLLVLHEAFLVREGVKFLKELCGATLAMHLSYAAPLVDPQDTTREPTGIQME